MNPNATPFTPKSDIAVIYNMPSVVENLFFDNLEKEFVNNNPWIFESENNSISSENKNFIIENKKNKKIYITFNP